MSSYEVFLLIAFIVSIIVGVMCMFVPKILSWEYGFLGLNITIRLGRKATDLLVYCKYLWA